MFEIKKQKELEEVIQEISDAVGIKTDADTMDYKVIQSIYDAINFINSQNNEMIKGYTISEKSGSELDSIWNDFGIERFSGTKIESIKFSFSLFGDAKISFANLAKFEYAGQPYELTSSFHFFSEKVNVFTAYAVSQPISFSNPINIGNNLVFESSDIDVISESNTDFEVLNYSLKLIDVSDAAETFETDSEYKSRAFKMLQLLGFSNKERVKNQLFSDSRIKDVIINDKPGYSEIIPFPYNIDELDAICSHIEEIALYFGLNNKIKKPNMISLVVNGVDNDDRLQQYLTSISKDVSEDLEINGEKTKIKIQNFCSENDIAFSNILLKLKYYIGENYKKSIMEKELNSETVKFRKENLFTFEVI